MSKRIRKVKARSKLFGNIFDTELVTIKYGGILLYTTINNVKQKSNPIGFYINSACGIKVIPRNSIYGRSIKEEIEEYLKSR